MVVLPDGEKQFEDMFSGVDRISSVINRETTSVTDRLTERHLPTAQSVLCIRITT